MEDFQKDNKDDFQATPSNHQQYQAPPEYQAYGYDQPDRRDDFQLEPSKHHQQQYATPPGSAPPVYGYDQPGDHDRDLGQTNRWEPHGPTTYHHIAPANMVSQYPNNVTVVTQPAPFNQIIVTSVNDNMGLAVFTCLCCFWPLGLMAILKSSEAQTAIAANRLADAKRFADQSRTYSRWSICIGCIVVFIGVVVMVTANIMNINSA